MGNDNPQVWLTRRLALGDNHTGRLNTHRILRSIMIVMLPITVFTAVGIAQSSGTPWTGTWASPPVQAESGRGFSRQTLRQIVHTSVAGDYARVQISNLFGKRPLQVEDVHIAVSGTDYSIIASTDRRVLFGGRSFATILPGAKAISDRVDFAVPRLADVDISLYLPGPTGPPTFHPSAHQTSYIASGDVSGSTILRGSTTTRSYYFVTNLDVQNRALKGAVVTLGASITEGYNSTSDANHRWPDFLARRLVDEGLGIGVLNAGISGNRLLADGAGPSAEHRFDRDVLAQPGVRWVIFSDDPINDLGSTTPQPTANQLIEGIKQLIARAHQRQILFFCSTLTPYEGANYWNQEGEAAREKVNAFLRSGHSGCDGIFDQDVATHDPAHPARYLPAYDSGDHLHPNDAGQQAIAGAVDITLLSKPAGLAEPNDLRGYISPSKRSPEFNRDAAAGRHFSR
jgi:lysophospholipase L1-like esterase